MPKTSIWFITLISSIGLIGCGNQGSHSSSFSSFDEAKVTRSTSTRSLVQVRVDEPGPRHRSPIDGGNNGGGEPTPTPIPDPALPTPSNLQASLVESQVIEVSWEYESFDQELFILEKELLDRNATIVHFEEVHIPRAARSYASCVHPSADYRFRIKARNADGDSEYSNDLNVQSAPGPAVPFAPTDLIATAISSGRAMIAWTNSSINADEFVVERKDNANMFFETQIVPSTITEVEEGRLNPSTEYTFRVKGRNSEGDSCSSNELTITTEADPYL